MSKQKTPLVAIVILNWNGRDDTLECLSSIYASSYTNFEVIVADNGSSDDSVKAIQSTYPKTHVLDLGENHGFAEGNNLAVERALQLGADVVFLLNNDTTIAPDCLTNFYEASLELPKSSVLGAKIAYYSEREMIWNIGAKWDSAKNSYSKIGQNASMDQFSEPFEVDHIIGCAMWIPDEVIREHGLFDKRFFLNFEETDWCMRVKNAGVQLWSVPKAILWHKISASFVSKLHNTYFMERNRPLWLSKHFSVFERAQMFWRGRVLKKLIRILRYPLRVIFYPFAHLFFKGYRRKLAYRITEDTISMVAWLHYLIGRFGNCPQWVLKLSKYFSTQKA